MSMLIMNAEEKKVSGRMMERIKATCVASAGLIYPWCGRKAMARHEPAALDIHGATWTGPKDYTLDPTAKRYEVYEMSMAAKVSSHF